MLETLWQDLRFALRMLGKTPGFAAIAILTLALGIGANTAIFSLTDQVLLRRLPVERPEELVVLRAPGIKRGRTWSDGDGAASFSYPAYRDLRANNNALAGLVARFSVALSVAGQGQTERANGELVSGNYFEVLGVRPALGRVFTLEDETAPGANPLAVLSYGYWTRRFANDPGVLNKLLTVNGTPLTVVGVARAGFAGVQVGQSPDIFIPITMKAQMTPNWDGLERRDDFWLAILGRLKPAITPQQAEAILTVDYRPVLEADQVVLKSSGHRKDQYLAKKILLTPGSKGRPILQSDVRDPLLYLSVVVAMVLLIGCANLAGLLMARGEARRQEIAVRLAMGAGRWRLVRQLLTESVVLALAGGAVGLVVAAWSVEVLVQMVAATGDFEGIKTQLDGRVLLFAFGVSLLTGLVFGLAPALRATRRDLYTTLKDQGGRSSAGPGELRLRKVLMGAQVALTAVLLVGAGLFAQSLMRLRQVDLGLRTERVIQFAIAPELSRYSPVLTAVFGERLRQRIAALPGVHSVSAAEVPILANSDSSSNVTVEGYTVPEGENENMDVMRNWVGPEYLATMGIPLIAGREFRESDAAGGPKVAVVNEAFVRRFFAGREAVGSRMAFGAGSRIVLDIEIVGVAKDSKHGSVRGEIRPFVYEPYMQDDTLGSLFFYVRTRTEPEAMAETLRNAVKEQDANLPVYDMKTLEAQVDEIVLNDRLVAYLSVTLAGLAAGLAALGLYGVMAYMVVRRTREIGIRMALGASTRNVSWLVLREVVMLAAVGLAAGLVAAFGLGRLVEAQLFGVTANDPVVLVTAAAVLVAVALLAGWVPARKAANLAPMVALRYE